jgi:hypothetical protein
MARLKLVLTIASVIEKIILLLLDLKPTAIRLQYSSQVAASTAKRGSAAASVVELQEVNAKIQPC